MSSPLPITAFNSGELSPYMRGRMNLQVYSQGCKELTNFIPIPQGGVISRTGTRRVDKPVVSPGTNVRKIEFSPNPTESFLLLFSNLKLTIYRRGVDAPVYTQVTPWTSAQIVDIDFEFQVDVGYITHPAVEPYILRYEGSNVFATEKLMDQSSFKTPPFQKEDTTGTELVVGDEVHYLKLTSTANDFSTVTALNLETNLRYIEIKINNKWALYRLIDTNVSAEVENPTNTTCFAIPLTAVVDDIEPAAQFIHIESDDYPDPNREIKLGTPHSDGGDWELRSDTLIWKFNLEGAYARIPNGYDNVISGASVTAKGDIWVRLLQFVGQSDHATEFLTGTRATADFEQGQVYRIVTPAGFRFMNAAPSKPIGESTRLSVTRDSEEVQWGDSFEYLSAGDTFSATNFFRVPTGGAGGANTIVSNLSTNRTFDVMRTSDKLNVITPSGVITFTEDSEVHRAEITADKDFFKFGAFDGIENNQYIMVRHGPTWVTYKVTGVLTARKAEVEVIGIIPTEKNSDELIDNGRSSVFRVSAWSSNNYPYTVALYDQRLVFGGSPNYPESVWLSKITDNYDFRTIEADGDILDTTGITYSLGGRSFNRIRSLVSGPVLIIGTESSEWQIRPSHYNNATTATNLRLTQETYIGSRQKALRVGSSVFFVERNGKYLREMQWDIQIESFKTIDLNILADHLFRTDPIVRFCYQQNPQSMFWFVTESGLLYSLTYDKERDVYAWARHRTRGGDKVIDAAVMRGTTTDSDDRLYLTVERGGDLFVEYLTPVFEDDGSDNFKKNMWTLDSGVRFPEVGTVFNTGEKTIVSASLVDESGSFDPPQSYILIQSPSHGFPNLDTVIIEGTGNPLLDGLVARVGNSATDTFVLYRMDDVTERILINRDSWEAADNPDKGTITRVRTSFSSSQLGEFTGQTVSVIVDGAYMGETEITGDSFSILDKFGRLCFYYTLFGFSFKPKLVTLPASLNLPDGGNLYGQSKRVKKLGMYLYESIGISYGQLGDRLQQINFHPTEASMSQSPRLFTGFKGDFTLDSGFDLAKELVIEQEQPYPLTILSLTPEY